MAYKFLGFAVWQVTKLVVRRQAHSAKTPRNLAIAGAVGVAIVGVLAAGRHSE
jgi:hypothetical protein